jgi:hypothetical protein
VTTPQELQRLDLDCLRGFRALLDRGREVLATDRFRIRVGSDEVAERMKRNEVLRVDVEVAEAALKAKREARESA